MTENNNKYKLMDENINNKSELKDMPFLKLINSNNKYKFDHISYITIIVYYTIFSNLKCFENLNIKYNAIKLNINNIPQRDIITISLY